MKFLLALMGFFANVRYHFTKAEFGALRKVGRHDFPKFDHRGHDATNEFQFVVPNNIIFNVTDEQAINEVFPTVIRNGDIVTVVYSASKPSRSDWIAAYSPEPKDINAVVPVKYGWCDEDELYLTTGKGSLQFNMTNLRANISFYFMRNSTNHPMVTAYVQNAVMFHDIDEPLRPRITPSGIVDVLNLQWSSNYSTAPMLYWGTSSKNYSKISKGSKSRIERSQLCGEPAKGIGWRDLGEIYTAKFEGISKFGGNFVYYIFGDKGSNTWSNEHRFRVPPIPGEQPRDRPTTVILYDDLGRGSSDQSYTWNEYGRPSVYTAMAVGAEASDGNIDAIYHGGDISYAVGYLAVWDFFMDMISPMASSSLYLTNLGNHESDWPDSSSYFTGLDSGGECGICATELIRMPYPATVNSPWWSYDIGLIHFVGMSTEHNFTIGSPQYVWLEHDLATVNRSLTPWVVFGGHRPMYINSYYSGSASADVEVMHLLIENIEPILFKYRVNLAFWGHNHAYQRMSATFQSRTVFRSKNYVDSEGRNISYYDDPQATVHVVVGTGGAKFSINYIDPYPEWCELVMYRYGYAKVIATNSTHLSWKFIESTTSTVYDSFELSQSLDFARPWLFVDSAYSDMKINKLPKFVLIMVTALFFAVLSTFAVYTYMLWSGKKPNLCYRDDRVLIPLNSTHEVEISDISIERSSY